MTPKDPLEALRAAGVARQTEAERARSTEQHLYEKERIENGKRATSSLGWLTYPIWWWAIGSVTITAVILAVAGAFEEPHKHGNHVYESSTLALVAGAFGVAGLMILARVVGTFAVRAAVRRELAWVSALPFPLLNHLKQLGSRRSRCTLLFKGNAPSAATVSELVAGVSVAQVSLRESDPIQLEVEFTSDSTDHSHWAGWRVFVNDLLIPVHGKWPLASVTIEG
jgi:hypothetical protein